MLGRDPLNVHDEPEVPLIDGWRELAKQVLLVALAVLFYFGVRGLTESAAGIAIEHGNDVLAFEQRIGIAFSPEFQATITDIPFLANLGNWVYIWGHWPVIVATLVWLHERHRYHYLLLRNAMFISGAIGLIIFMLYPVAPPRLIDAGYIDTVTSWSTSYRVLQPPSLVNKYAAIPSLHVGWNLLVAIELWRASRSAFARSIALIGPLLMPLSVIVTANHYVLDGVAGALVAAVGYALAIKITLPLASTLTLGAPK